jgi:hypothetical protein
MIGNIFYKKSSVILDYLITSLFFVKYLIIKTNAVDK